METSISGQAGSQSQARPLDNMFSVLARISRSFNGHGYGCNGDQPYGHDKARVLQVIGVRLVVVYELNIQSKLVQGDPGIHLGHSQLKETTQVVASSGNL